MIEGLNEDWNSDIKLEQTAAQRRLQLAITVSEIRAVTVTFTVPHNSVSENFSTLFISVQKACQLPQGA